jgi:hypothetical protein
MSARRLFVAAVTAYCLGLLGWLLWPAFQESFLGKIVGGPPFSIYVFEHFGVPGLTDRNRCDWIWCKPTMLGIVFTAAVWLGAAWFVSIGIVRLAVQHGCRQVAVRLRRRGRLTESFGGLRD